MSVISELLVIFPKDIANIVKSYIPVCERCNIVKYKILDKLHISGKSIIARELIHKTHLVEEIGIYTQRTDKLNILFRRIDIDHATISTQTIYAKTYELLVDQFVYYLTHGYSITNLMDHVLAIEYNHTDCEMYSINEDYENFVEDYYEKQICAIIDIKIGNDLVCIPYAHIVSKTF